MKKGWEYREFEECIVKVPKQKQIKSKDYLLSGNYPVVSQEQELISGYYNDESYVYKHSKPVVVFGDHTKNIKYIDFDFVVGADGTQILMTIEKIETKFFYYALKSIKLENLGYARHFKLLKKKEIGFPNIAEQRRIVSYLDSSFDLIDKIKENASKSLSEAKALFQSALAEAMEPKEGWEEKTLGEIAEIKGGKRVPKGYKLLTEPTNHKYIRVADFNDFGSINLDNIQYISDEVYNQIRRYTISTKDVYISIAGTIGKSGIIPKELEGANLTENACKLVLDSCAYKHYIYYFTKSSIFVRQIEKLTMVSAQPKLALTRLATVKISLPPLSTQKQIVSRLDSLSSKIRAIEEKYQKMIAECDAMKQAMLREVFE